VNNTIVDPQTKVAEMMEMYDQEVKEFPVLPDEATRLLRARLTFEECMEFVKAMGCKLGINLNSYSKSEEGEIVIADEPTLRALPLDQISIEIDPNGKPDLTETADAIADIQVVNLGAANACGIPSALVFDEVHRSNMTKRWPDGTIHKREDGKVIKPDTYSPADIEEVFSRQHMQLLKEKLSVDSTISAMFARAQDLEFNLYDLLTASVYDVPVKLVDVARKNQSHFRHEEIAQKRGIVKLLVWATVLEMDPTEGSKQYDLTADELSTSREAFFEAFPGLLQYVPDSQETSEEEANA